MKKKITEFLEKLFGSAKREINLGEFSNTTGEISIPPGETRYMNGTFEIPTSYLGKTVLFSFKINGRLVQREVFLDPSGHIDLECIISEEGVSINEKMKNRA